MIDCNALIGRKVRLTRDIIQPATGDHPDLLLGKKGEEVTVIDTAFERDYPFIVSLSGASFGISDSEFETPERAGG